MLGKTIKVLFVIVIALGLGCQKKAEKVKDLVKVGTRVFTQADLDGYAFITRAYPHELTSVFPGERRQITAMVEIEALYRRIPWGFSRISLSNSPDWQWKQRYFPAQMYAMDVLSRNMGFMQEDIDRYYEANKDSFKVTIKVPASKDTTKKDPATGAPVTKDSITYKPVIQVRDNIIKTLFSSKFKPDADWLKKTFKDSLPDSTTVNNQWYGYVKNNGQDFFLKLYYQDIYGQKMPDSLKDWFGEGKTITPKDMDVIMNWVPDARRANYKTPQGQKDLAMWLLRWKVFSEQGKRIGFTAGKRMASAREWAWKIEVVMNYVKKSLIPHAEEMTKIDTSLCAYSYWDERNAVIQPPDTAGLNQEIKRQYEKEMYRMVDSLVYTARKQVGVVFMQNDWRDEKDKNPADLLRKADSLRDTGNVDEAERLYRTLTTDFAFSQAANKAFNELAKIQTEKQMYREAITNYRTSMVSGKDPERLCNTFFMIGFIYDEYLNQSAMAEVNYKWILKNTPQCELADDAEFMCLHLDEPMIRIEELRAEALRQGRKVDDEPVAEEANTDTAAKSSN
jgi:hypothetical protein